MAEPQLFAAVVLGSTHPAPSLVTHELDAWLYRPRPVTTAAVVYGGGENDVARVAAWWANNRRTQAIPMPAPPGRRYPEASQNGLMLRVAEALRECCWQVDVLAFPVGEAREIRRRAEAFETFGFTVLVHEFTESAPSGLAREARHG